MPSVSAPDRPLSYRNYGDQKLVSAVEAVQRGMSIRRACEEYGVPKSTLHDKVSGKSGLNAKSGSQRRLLSDEEESRLAAFLCGCAAIGYAKSRKDVLAIAQQIVNSHHPESQPEVSKGWWDSFKRRHPELTLRHSEALSYARAAANNLEAIQKYFNLLQQTLQENGLTHKLHRFLTVMRVGYLLHTSLLRWLRRLGRSTRMLSLVATRLKSPF